MKHAVFRTAVILAVVVMALMRTGMAVAAPANATNETDVNGSVWVSPPGGGAGSSVGSRQPARAGVKWRLVNGALYLNLIALGSDERGSAENFKVNSSGTVWEVDHDRMRPIPNGEIVLRVTGGRLMGPTRLWRVTVPRDHVVNRTFRGADGREMNDRDATTVIKARFVPLDLPDVGAAEFRLSPDQREGYLSAGFVLVPESGTSEVTGTLNAWGREEGFRITVPPDMDPVRVQNVQLPERVEVPFGMASLIGAGTITMSATGAVWAETGTSVVEVANAPVTDDVLLSMNGSLAPPSEIRCPPPERHIPPWAAPVTERPVRHLVLLPDSSGSVTITERNLSRYKVQRDPGETRECSGVMGVALLPWETPIDDAVRAGILPVVTGAENGTGKRTEGATRAVKNGGAVLFDKRSPPGGILPLLVLTYVMEMGLLVAMGRRKVAGRRDKVLRSRWMFPPQEGQVGACARWNAIALGYETDIGASHGAVVAEMARVSVTVGNQNRGLRIEASGPSLNGEAGTTEVVVGRRQIRALRMSVGASLAEARAGVWVGLGPLDIEFGGVVGIGYSIGSELAIGLSGISMGVKFGVLWPIIGGYVRVAW